MIKLIASDMDGTFLNPQGRYDKERFQQLLDQLTEKIFLLSWQVVIAWKD